MATINKLQTTKQHQKLYGLDHLRALAIILVFFFHYMRLTGAHPGWLPSVAKFGWTGVDLFFVLSGFLISSQLFAQIKKGEPISFRVFFLKRFFRIIPAYWFTLAIYFLFPFFHEKETLSPLWKFLTFTQNLGLDRVANGTFSHAWSLCVEEHFYLLLPLTLILLQFSKWRNKAYWLLIALFVFGFAIRYFSYTQLFLPTGESASDGRYWNQYLYYPTYTRLDGLLAGVSIAAISQFTPNTWRKISGHGHLFMLLGLLLFMAAYIFCKDERSLVGTVFGFPLVDIGFGCIVIGAVSPGSFLYKWQSKVTSFIAAISYALYLTHKGIIHVTQTLLEGYHLDDNIVLLASLINCVLAAWLVRLLVEKPFMKLRDRLVGQKKARPGGVPEVVKVQGV